MKEHEVEEKVYGMIQNQYQTQKLSHAYFIEKGNYANIEMLMKKIAKLFLCPKNGEHFNNCSTCDLIEKDIHPDFKEISPEGNMIKKEQLLNLKQLFKTTSSSNYRLYVIYEADKLNPASANTILKFLEEPEQGIIAFLIADNRYQVLETLLSRCQIINMPSLFSSDFSDEMINLLSDLTSSKKIYLDFKELLDSSFSLKESTKDLLDSMELYLHQLLLIKIGKKIPLPKQELFTNLTEDSIIKYIAILEEEKKKLTYNINYKLWLDHFLIRFMEVIS